MSTQEEPDERDDDFFFDPTDGTYCLDVWFSKEKKEKIQAFCQSAGLNPRKLVEYGIRAVIDASSSPQGMIFVYGLPTTN